MFGAPALALRFLDYEQHDDPGRLARLALTKAFAESPEAGRAAYRELRSSHPQEATAETLGRVGHQFLQNDDTQTALAVFRLAAEENHGAWQAHDGLGEALMAGQQYGAAVNSYRKALELDGGNEEVESKLDWARTRLGAAKSPVEIEPETLERYAGTYGPRRITLDGDALYYQRDSNPRYRLVPLAPDLFALDGLETFRLRFVEDDEGRVTKVVGLYLGGNEDVSPRDP